MRYYFHIREFGHLTLDEEGMDLLDITEARTEARLSASELAMAAIRSGIGFGAGKIEIADGKGNVFEAVTVQSILN
jgi:hypothetical protein